MGNIYVSLFFLEKPQLIYFLQKQNIIEMNEEKKKNVK